MLTLDVKPVIICGVPRLKVIFIQKTGCPKCNRSHGELACQQILDNLCILYQIEHIIPSLPRRKFDFQFAYGQRIYIIEFDGL